ncbi:SDR family NAD(P)-dependent oxidoreductase [Kribbella solani]|uniref:SDR family NAD(P)-dependent oxidoreductase n=1 Tax=Kribbella solani TaxID=236067 RepID=UPI0029A56144|nr:SDR family NAD(P)-dependent oxidoreductase [Kribbella solani]MDX3006197.1 SDR family NAD(P)-dependent oxidoreductase [Kribbella solani]
MRLDGRIALVTGGSAGIGAAVVDRLAAAGARVVVHGRDEQRAAAVAERVGGAVVLGDLAVPGVAVEVAGAALAIHGQIDVLIANAGAGWSGPFTELSGAELEHLVGLNLLAPLQLVRSLLPPMVERGSGHVALVGSIAGRTGVAGEAVYAATKAALDVFAESLRLELRDTGVGVSLTVPGVVDTGFFAARGRPYDRARPRPVPADRVARALVDGITNDRAESWVPRWLRVAPAVRGVAPGVYRRLSARFGEQVHGR